MSTNVTENCYRDSVSNVMTQLIELMSTDSGDADQTWTLINLGDTSGAFLSHVQQHFPGNVSCLNTRVGVLDLSKNMWRLVSALLVFLITTAYKNVWIFLSQMLCF